MLTESVLTSPIATGGAVEEVDDSRLTKKGCWNTETPTKCAAYNIGKRTKEKSSLTTNKRQQSLSSLDLPLTVSLTTPSETDAMSGMSASHYRDTSYLR